MFLGHCRRVEDLERAKDIFCRKPEDTAKG